MAKTTIYHNPRCSASRHAMTSAEDRDVQVVEYLKTPLERAELLHLIGKLEDPPADLVRKDAFFQAQGLKPEDYTQPEQVADLLARFPRLMQPPVLVRGDIAIIGRPKERAEQFLAEG